jgi:hypothetical protein
MNWKVLIAALTVGVGAFFISHGAFEISDPVGFIVTGLMLLVGASLPDWGA